MINVPVAYDVTRLFLGPLSATPRGIDRVDFALASRFFRQSHQPCVGVIPTPWGTRVFSRRSVRRGLTRLQQLWSERNGASDTQRWSALLANLTQDSSQPTAIPPVSQYRTIQRAQRLASLIAASETFFGRSAHTQVPENAVYLNVGHLSLALPLWLRWLNKRPDVTPVFMLHDVIPLDAPEYVSASSTRLHAAMVANTAQYAAGLLVSTKAAQATVREALARCGRNDIPTLVQALPLPAAFSHLGTVEPSLKDVPYFVVCGAIEPRKNHALLFDIWRGLAAKLGSRMPHLVVVGSPGWRGRQILDQLEGDAALRGRVHVVSGLGTQALKRLLQGAIGLLMPSHAEGFGLPLIEAARLGVPVMASDIAAHREVIGRQALLVSATDRAAWQNAIEHWCAGGRPETTARAWTDVAGERDGYFRSIEAFLEQRVAERAQEIRMAAFPANGLRLANQSDLLLS